VSGPFDETVTRVLRETPGHALPALFRFVQAMPYRFPGPRDPLHTLQHGWGTCAGKNYLLAELLRAAGVPVAHQIATGDLRDALPDLPSDLRALAESGPLPDVHSFLTAVGPDGPVVVDASWDPSLAALGFPVQGDWDGCSDTVLALRPHVVYAVCGPDPSTEKDAIRARLYRGREEDRRRRDVYLARLSEWMVDERESRVANQERRPTGDVSSQRR
jgi:hypothetical protein